MIKTYTDKQGRFQWRECPKCGQPAVFALEDNYELMPDDGKHITNLTEALFYPHAHLDHFEKGCIKGSWHIILRWNK